MIIAGFAIVYILATFVVIWFSGRFIGIQSMTIKEVGYLGLAIILLSWLIGSALFYVPLIIKPFIILIAGILIIYIFISILDTHILKAIAAGLFFIVCQLIIIVVLLKELWTKDFFQEVKFMLFQLY